MTEIQQALKLIMNRLTKFSHGPCLNLLQVSMSGKTLGLRQISTKSVTPNTRNRVLSALWLYLSSRSSSKPKLSLRFIFELYLCLID